MAGITLENITEAVIKHGDEGLNNPRLHEIYASLVKHLHAFQREVNLSTAELDIGRQFLFKLAQPNQDFPMGEIPLLSDCLGLSEVSVLIEDAGNAGTTEMNIDDGLYIAGLPERGQGAKIGEDPNGDPLFITHKFLDRNGKPLANAIVDVWQANGDGCYFVQHKNLPVWNFYARLRTSASGELHFQTVIPGDYAVSTSGPAGALLEQLGRHAYRAAHINYCVRAEGHADFTTMMFFNHSPYIDSDTLFAVRQLRVDPVRHTDADAMKARGVSKPFFTLDYTFIIP